MNCKQGDLAIIVHSVASNEGKIVRCLRLTTGISLLRPTGALTTGSIWEIDQELVGWGGGRDRLICDEQLRPIRNPGADAIDEMVKLAGPAPMTLTELLREVSE